MGYRSEIVIGCKVDDPIAWHEDATDEDRKVNGNGIFLLMLTEMQQDPIAGRCFGDAHEINSYLRIDKENRVIMFEPNDSLKWYESYEDVQAYERLYKIMEEYAENYDEVSSMKRNPISCVFVRVGEESDDVEERGAGDDPWSIASVYRGIDIHI